MEDINAHKAKNHIAQPLQQSDDLRNELEKYKALIKASNIGAWQYFSETEYLWCNEICFSMLGRDINNYDLSGKKNLNATWIDLLHPEDVETATTRFGEYLKNPQGTYENHYRMQHIDGNWIWIWSRGNLLPGSNKSPYPVVVGTNVDITYSKGVEETIQQERVMLRTLIDNLPDAIYIKDAEGRKIIANTTDVVSIGAASEADVIGKTDLELFPNEIGLRCYQDDMSVLKEGISIIDKDEFFLDAGGIKRWLLTSKIPIRDENGRIIRLLGIGHDITNRKKSEETLNKLNQDLQDKSDKLSKQAEDLKSLNEELAKQKEQELEKAIAQGKFEIASEVLHDIGNAMVGFGSHLNRINRSLEQNNLDTIKSLALFLKGQQLAISGIIGADKAAALVTITDGIAKTQATNHEEISVSVKDLLNIISHIQEILNIQRQLVRGHGGVHERKPVNLINIIEDCKAMLFAALDKKNILFKTSIQPGSYVIKGDHTKLMQVILNILKNSVEAIDFDAEEKEIGLAMQIVDDIIELTITDNGQGFDQEISHHFFERGFTTKTTGTGLGLYNCRSIVESHAGSLEINSKGKGLGAVITIKFAL